MKKGTEMIKKSSTTNINNELHHAYIPPTSLAPSKELIEAAKRNKDKPLKYDKKNDYYYQERNQDEKLVDHETNEVSFKNR